MKWGIILYFFSLVVLTAMLALYSSNDEAQGNATAPMHKSHS